MRYPVRGGEVANSFRIVTTQIRLPSDKKLSSNAKDDDGIELHTIDKPGNGFSFFRIRSSRPIDQFVDISVQQAVDILNNVLENRSEYAGDIVNESQTALDWIEKNDVSFKTAIEKTLNKLQSLDVLDNKYDETDNVGNADVNGIVSSTDDPTVPVSTFRVWFIGLWFSVIGSCINNFFAERLPGIGISGFVAQLVAYPAGKLCERILSTKKYKTLGYEWSLNPGPFTAKEHILITIMSKLFEATSSRR